LLVLLVLAAGLTFYLVRRTGMQEVIFRELDLKAELKAKQLTDWREERISDARFLMRAPAVASDIAALLAQPESAAAQQAVNGWLSSMKGGTRYDAVFLLDANRKIVVAYPPAETVTCSHLTGLAPAVLAGPAPYFSDLHRHQTTTPAHFDLVAPIMPPGVAGEAARHAPIAYVVLRVSPEEFVFPLLSRWPTASDSAETLLIRREGNEVVHLNPYRHRTGGALTRHPFHGNPNQSGAFSPRDDHSVVGGTDYRGVAVLTAVRTVPGTDWLMVSKVDQAEAFAPLRHEAWVTTAFVSLLIVAVFLGNAYLGQTRQGELLARALKAERQGKMLADRLALVTHYANDIVLLADENQRILEANERALQAYGLTLEELRHRQLADLRSPGSRQAADFDKAMVWLKGSATFESEHIRADGTVFPVEVNGRRALIDGRPHLLEVIRDISERKQAEAARLAEQQKQRLLFSASPQPMWLFDVETLAFLEVNAAAVRQYGFTRDEFLAMTIREIRPPSELPALLANLKRAPNLPTSPGPWRHRRKDGSELLVEVTGESITVAGRRARLVVAADVTARVQAEQALRESEDRFRLVFENSLDAILLTAPDGQIFAANPAACRLFGRTEPEIRREGRRGVVDPEDGRLEPLFAERARHGHVQGELRFKRADGTKFEAEVKSAIFHDAKGRLRGSMVIHDITTRKAAFAALQESEARFRTILEAAPDAVFIQARGRFTYLNPSALRLFGAQRAEELLDQSVPARMSPEYRPVGVERIRQLNEERKPVPNVEGEFLRLDGSRVLVEVSAVPFNYQGLDGALVFARDISQRKTVEKDLRESAAQARAMLEAMPAAVFIQARHQFAYANPAALQLFGATRREELIGRPILERVMTDSVTASQNRMQRTNERREIAPREEMHFKRMDETGVVTEVVSIPFNYNGDPGALVFAIDVTNQRKEEKARAEQVEELRRWQAITLGRENRLLDLKREVNELLAASGRPARYDSARTP
jgi:PAS domain S-box-containing protein